MRANKKSIPFALSMVALLFCMQPIVRSAAERKATSTLRTPSPETAADPTAVALPIAAVYQQTPVWCWLAVGEMVHRYYDIPTLNPVGNYQCGLIATLAGPNTPCWQNCGACIAAAGNYGPVNQVVLDMLRRYPEVVRSVNRYNGPSLNAEWRYSALSDVEIKNEIDGGRPVIAGISPSGYPQNVQSEHVALVIGYEQTNTGFNLIVNDPFPFSVTPFNQRPDPYLAQGGQPSGTGQYVINAQRFTQGLVWRESFYNISRGAAPAQEQNAFRCVFQAEPGLNYFVRSNNQIVVALPNGEQRVVGQRTPPTFAGFAWMYSTAMITYGVDAAGRVWNRGPAGPFQVGFCGQ